MISIIQVSFLPNSNKAAFQLISGSIPRPNTFSTKKFVSEKLGLAHKDIVCVNFIEGEVDPIWGQRYFTNVIEKYDSMSDVSANLLAMPSSVIEVEVTNAAAAATHRALSPEDKAAANLKTANARRALKEKRAAARAAAQAASEKLSK